jgi:Tol biopolymer transport system component
MRIGDGGMTIDAHTRVACEGILIFAVLLATALHVPSSAVAATERVSLSSAGTPARSVSGEPELSGDGRFVVFVSSASNLVPGDINGQEVFVRDRAFGTTQRVAVDAAGNQATRSSAHPAMSADGRFVAFESIAPNLVPGDTNGREDVFVKDRLTGTVDRVSVTSTGKQALADSGRPAISDDGRFVAFESSASLVPDDTNRSGDAGSDGDVFVRDRLAGTTTRVSVDSAGREVADGSAAPSISADGRYVGFVSRVPGLVPDDRNGKLDAFVHDRVTGATERVSVGSAGEEGNGDSGPPRLSADGRWAVFSSDASNLTRGDANGARDVFMRDRLTGRTLRVSTDLGGADADGPSDLPDISRDGRVVGFGSAASDLVAADSNGAWDAFIREIASGRTRRVSVDSAGVEGNGPSTDPLEGAGGVSLSGDGRFAAFSSNATNLVSDPIDTNGVRDVFVRGELFAPSAVTAPKITGAAVRGQTLTGTPGTWAGTPEITLAYQWQRCDATGAGCVNIPGAAGLQLTLVAEDVGHAIRMRVRARNDEATVWRSTAATSPVAPG